MGRREDFRRIGVIFFALLCGLCGFAVTYFFRYADAE
jgi:hypothetical protein